jgi:serine phosphatase RsbU (regulator of sigma subunit)
MKKAERILGWTGMTLFVLGLIFRSLHWPGGAILVNISTVILAAGYLPLLLIRERRETRSTVMVIYLIFRFIVLFFLLFTFLFKSMHWPGAGLLYVFASPLLPLLIIFYLILAGKGLTGAPLKLSTTIMFVVGFSIFTYVNRSSVSLNVVNGYLQLEEKFRTTAAGLMSANSTIYESLETSKDSSEAALMASIRELRKSSIAFSLYIDSLEEDFLALFALDTLDRDLEHYGLRLMSGNNLSDEYFIDAGNAHKLKLKVDQYASQLMQIKARHQIPVTIIGVGPEQYQQTAGQGDSLIWEKRTFGGAPVAACITNLRWIQLLALMNENDLLNALINQFDLSDETQLIRELASKESRQAIELKENEILRINQQKELQDIQLESARAELRQRNFLLIMSVAGIGFVIVLLIISTRAYFRKQKDMQELKRQKTEIESQRDEIEAQRDEIGAQRDEIEAQRDMVQDQKEQIERTHHEISSSIDYAMRLQDAMLPSPVLLEEHFSGHLIFFRPKQKVSGDFYWWTLQNDRVVIAVADCTGHGVPGAFMSLLGSSLLKEIVNREGITAPGAILDRMREEVIATLNQRGSLGEQKDGMDMSVVCIDPGTLTCQYAGANSPLYLLRRGKLHVYTPDLMPVSYYEEMLPFQTTGLSLEPADQLYLFSDGYADQFGGEHRKKFKYKNFRQIITEYADLSMSRQQQVLSDIIREWQGKYEQTDDMVIVGIRI